ncbi:MAG: carbonic anhydrase [Eggerthellaceae bacterium]|nr:carbonic anhydrase [Eggerthellaceae bacterium]
MVSATEALNRLKTGNRDFITVRRHERDLSPERVEELYTYGQNPFAVVLTCSDSRTVPEHMFMMGLGDLFVVRVAGNVVGPAELASIVYACEHLRTKLVLVLGHTGCGAIEAAMQALDGAQLQGCGRNDGENGAAGGNEGEHALDALVRPIGTAIGAERDPYGACELNVRAGMRALGESPSLKRLLNPEDGEEPLMIAGAIYHTHSGTVDFLK